MQITPQLFADVFEADKRGAALLEHLIQRFASNPPSASGIDRIINTFEHQGRRQVLDYIFAQINRAAGVVDEPVEVQTEN